MQYLIQCLTDHWHRICKAVGDGHIVAFALTIGATGTYLCGDSFWGVLFLSFGAVFIDTIIKWIAVTKRYYVDTTGCTLTEVRIKQIIIGILGKAWEEGYLQSSYFSRISEKIFIYTLIIGVCHAAGKWMPAFGFGGLGLNPATVFPAATSVSIFLVELSSINENLKEAGHTGIADKLANIVQLVASKFTPKL